LIEAFAVFADCCRLPSQPSAKQSDAQPLTNTNGWTAAGSTECVSKEATGFFTLNLSLVRSENHSVSTIIRHRHAKAMPKATIVTASSVTRVRVASINGPDSSMMKWSKIVV